MKVRVPQLLLSLLVLSVSSAAQQVSLRGKVEDVSGTTNVFVVDCTDVTLTSSAFNLNLFQGQQTTLGGQWNGSVSNPVIDVTSISNVAESFEVGGSAKIGEELSFEVTATPGLPTTVYASTDPGFTRFGAAGVILIDLHNSRRIGTGTIPASGTREFKTPLPNSTSLIGVTIYGQALVGSGASRFLSNPDCKEISS